ncbi:hypothetical protein F2S74_20445 [Pseudomonas syringae pv. actinidiae]|nr:hypothetical protein [Pseudomonas syringae pv. actinidiae]
MKPQNEKTRQNAGFSEISKAAKTTFETLYGAGTAPGVRIVVASPVFPKKA